MCSSHVFDIGHWKSVLILAEEQDQMRLWEALILSMKGLGSCYLRNKSEWSCLKPWYWGLEAHSCHLRFKAEGGCGKALILGMWSVFMWPEEQGQLRLWEAFILGMKGLCSCRWRNKFEQGCLVMTLGMKALCSCWLRNKTEWGCGKLFSQLWYWMAFSTVESH